MQAIIYAAGIGMRLNKAFGGIPKILLEFGGKSLLEWHLVRLGKVGVTEVTIVCGYQHELVEEAVGRLQSTSPVRLRTLVNEHCREGSILSVAVSLPLLRQCQSTVLLMDGDVLYPSLMLQRLLDAEPRTCLLVDQDFSTADDDPVLVPIKDGRPFEFVKKWSGTADLHGESIGFFKFHPEDLIELIRETEDRCQAGDRKSSYDEIIRALVQRGLFGYEDVTGIPWTELDFPEDVARANREVLPAVLAAEKTA